MIKKSMWIIALVMGLAGAILLTGFSPTPQASPNRQEGLSFVYGTNHFNGSAYQSTFVPPTVNTIYLIADNKSMLASRFTQVFYWPLTGEQRADWGKANINVEGSLEILQDGKVTNTIPMTSYVIQYDGLNKLDTLRLYLGDEAVSARQIYEDQQRQYRQDLYAYHQALEAYRQEFQAALADLQAGSITEDQLPVRPWPLQDFSLFSTELLAGYPVELPPGSYTIQLRLPDGSLQEDSQKRLVVFSPIQEGIGYEIFAEERWSVPEQSTNEKEVIYSLPDTNVYLKPFYQIQFNELFYTRMNNPQDTQSRQDKYVWVPFEYVKEGQLLLNKAGQALELPMKDYYVQQIAGNTLGYKIIVHDPASDQSPTFRGFQVVVDATEMYIDLMDGSGERSSSSRREIRTIQTRNANWVYGLSAIPLLIGVIAIFLRRGAVKNIKMNGQEP